MWKKGTLYLVLKRECSVPALVADCSLVFFHTKRMRAFLWILVCCFLTTLAKTVKVTRPTQLIELFNKGSNGYIDVNIDLDNDIDFSLVQLKIPLGVQQETFQCLPYTGIFNGNGHSIKNLNIELTQNGVGLFCRLERATIKNLVIEDSCSFTGGIAGALTPYVLESGDVTFSNVKNQADVKGGQFAGGYVGVFLEGQSSNIQFQNCDNSGSIDGTSNGGFIGLIGGAKNMKVEFIECHNHGLITGSYGTGGFIGNVSSTEVITVIIKSSTNSGKVNGSDAGGGIIGVIQKCSGVTLDIRDTFVENSVNGSDNVGGLIGIVTESYAITLDIHNSDVTVSTSGHNSVGGFVGNFSKNVQVEINVNMSNSTGVVKGEQYVGGLFGVIQSSSPSKQAKVTITNTIRKNTLIGTTLASCGFVCVDEDSTYAVKVIVFNSISHGSVQGEKAYGIANYVTEIMNVVNTGSVSGTSKSYSLWKSPTANQHAYAYGSSCKTCGTATQIIKSNQDGQYYVVGTKMKIVDMLNFVVNQDHHWKTLSFWTKDLEFEVKKEGQLSLASFFSLSFTALFFTLFLMLQGFFIQ